MSTLSRLLHKVSASSGVDTQMIIRLHENSKYILSLYGLLIILVTIFFYDVLGGIIIAWCGVLIGLITIRLFLAYLTLQAPQKYDPKKHYVLFFSLSVATSLAFSVPIAWFHHLVDPYYQVMFLTLIMGVASGSIALLFIDFRLSSFYLTILIGPQIVTLFFSSNPDSFALIVALVLFSISLFGILKKQSDVYRSLNAMRSKEYFFQNLFKEAPIGIMSFDDSFHILDCNHSINRALMRNQEESLIGFDLCSLEERGFVLAVQETFKKGSAYYTGSFRSTSGDTFWIEAMFFTYDDPHRKQKIGVGIIEDKTKEFQTTEELRYLVRHDVLTGLLNRRGLRQAMGDLVAQPKHRTHYSLLHYIDLNRFKEINDTMGHLAGDEVLKEIADRLRSSFSQEIIIARMSGDEFIMISPYVAQRAEEAEHHALKLNKKLQSLLEKPIAIDESFVYVSASIGVAFIRPNDIDIQEIVRHADSAMYRAKRSIERFAFYDKITDRTQKESFIMQNELLEAFKNGEITLFMQPIVQIETGDLRGCEALIRWKHPRYGMVMPDTFIPLAIRSGTISKISWWVIEEVCRNLSRWKELKLSGLPAYISINVNAHTLLEANFALRFFDMLARYSLQSHEVVLELTERSLIDNFERMQSVIDTLKAKGVRCAIDDFGTGYSSLSYLKKLSFDILKIDKEFVKNIAHNDPKEIVLMNSILTIGKEYGYSVIVEGIENQEQYEILKTLDPTIFAQGFYHYRPMPLEKCEELFQAL